MSSPRDIMLGAGVFSFGEAATTSSLTDIAVTRGGGNFNITRAYRNMVADGDRGPVKGRIEIDEEITILTVRALEMLPANINDFYPAMNSSAGAAATIITSTMEIADGDYKKVRFTGKTKGGNAIMITVDNAINLDPLNWDLLDKEEVVPELKFTATSLEATTSVMSWDIEYATT